MIPNNIILKSSWPMLRGTYIGHMIEVIVYEHVVWSHVIYL